MGGVADLECLLPRCRRDAVKLWSPQNTADLAATQLLWLRCSGAEGADRWQQDAAAALAGRAAARPVEEAPAIAAAILTLLAWRGGWLLSRGAAQEGTVAGASVQVPAHERAACRNAVRIYQGKFRSFGGGGRSVQRLQHEWHAS